ncbi:MAG: PilZ domain-containing protein [Alphaproteobacteria bacterium]|nr:PilZ domain-containing protein [Alphaproteobacteria bacterium]MBV9371550.1 PilZ domain-containing protein [Alphaproteobacteria bacterium]MBV9902708.1 PilZ domain-containing protein [Alphaproteobacteria bacterium]
MHEIRSSILSGEARPATPVARKSKAGRGGEGLGGLTKIAIRRQEARVTDQRIEDRLRNVVEETTILFRRRRIDVRVVNVSSRGAMIAADIEPRIGEKIDLLFAEPNRTKCAVRWVREGRIGVEFLNETIFWETKDGEAPVFKAEPAERTAPGTGTGPRDVVEREPRQALLRRGTLYWSGISIPVRLRNISARGARLESEREFVPGSEVELDLGESGFQVAEVRWSKDGQVGLRFAGEFSLDSLAPAPAAVAGPAPDVLKPAYLETELRPDSPWAARFERLSLTDLKMIDPEG